MTTTVAVEVDYAFEVRLQQGQGHRGVDTRQGEGNGQVSGSWKITDHKTSTHIELQLQVSVDLPIPPVMKMVVAPLREAEFERLTDIYIDNLIQRFGGEV